MREGSESGVLGDSVCVLCCRPGRNFDKNGNMLDWWSNFSAQHFRKQSECMVYQYSNFSWELAGNQNVSLSPGLQWPHTCTHPRQRSVGQEEGQGQAAPSFCLFRAGERIQHPQGEHR